MFLIETRAVVTETTLTSSAAVTVETRSLLTRKSGVYSLVGVGDNISREVEELSEVLETRISKGVVEVAPNHY